MTTLEMQPLPSGKVVNFSGAAVVQDQGQSVTAEVTPRLTGVSGETSTNGVTDEENSRMQVCWNQAMCKEMEIPEGYQSVAVLIIKWCKELDQLKSESEVSQSSTPHRTSLVAPYLMSKSDSLSEPFSLEYRSGSSKNYSGRVSTTKPRFANWTRSPNPSCNSIAP